MARSMSLETRKWLTLLSCGLVTWMPGAITFGLIGLLIPCWVEKFNTGVANVALVMTFLILALGCVMPFAGRISDRLGARKTMTIGAFADAAAVLLFLIVPNVQTLYLFAFLFGAGTCFLYIPALTSAQKWLQGKRGLAAGAVDLFFGLSAACMIPAFRMIFVSHGYAVVIIFAAALLFGICLAFAQFSEFPERTPYGKSINSRQDRGDKSIGAREEVSFTVKQAARCMPFWQIWICWATVGAAGIGMAGLTTSIGGSLGLTPGLAATCLVAFSITNGVGRFAMGALSDKIGRIYTLFSAFLIGILGFFVLAFLSSANFPLIFTCALFAGLMFGTLFAVSASLIMDLFGTKHYGAIFGIIFTAYGFIASWAGPFIGGLLMDRSGGSTWTCVLFGIYAVIAAMVILFIRHPVTKRIV